MTKPIVPHISQGLQGSLILAPKKYPNRRPRVRDHGQYRTAAHFHQSPYTPAELLCLANRNRWDYARTHETDAELKAVAARQYDLWQTALLAQSAADREQRKAA